MRTLVFAYSQAGAVALEALRALGFEIAGLITHRDDPRENRWYRTPAEAAAELGVPTSYDDAYADADTLEAHVSALAPELILSVFYRSLIPPRVLARARVAALNLHPSLLPAYRGRATINWLIANGAREAGVTLHHMTARADAGDIVMQRPIALDPRETALTLYRKVESEGRLLLDGALPLVARGTAPRTPQDASRATYFGRRRPQDGRIDWSWDTARVDRLVRAVAPPWPGAFGWVDGELLGIHEGTPALGLGIGPPMRPGDARRIDGRVHVGTADGWYRIDRGTVIHGKAEART